MNAARRRIYDPFPDSPTPPAPPTVRDRLTAAWANGFRFVVELLPSRQGWRTLTRALAVAFLIGCAGFAGKSCGTYGADVARSYTAVAAR